MKRFSAFAIVTLLASHALAAPTRKPPKPPDPPKPPVVTAKPTHVDVVVTEIAGTRAYLTPGAKAGVHRDSIVTINGKEHRVFETTDSYAVITLQEGPVKEKDKGRATIVEEQEVKPPPPPHPLSTWEHAWTEEAPPASTQQPTYVPLGEASRNRRYDATLAFTAGGLIPLPGQAGSSLGYVQFDAKVHAEPFSVPAALDFDGSLRFYAAQDLSSRVGGQTRSYLLVRELLASYGSAQGWYAGIGRMKYAASTLGSLDGIRLQAPLGGGVSLSAFGGFLPNPLGGELAVDAERFGVEARLYRPDLKLRPEGALVIHGSLFDGKPDERRISAMFAVYPGHSRLGGHVEVSNFDSNNPWGVAPVEVTAAGLDSSVRVGIVELGSRIDLIEPERSRWLASYLPSSWFCRTVPTNGTPPSAEPCDGRSSMRAQGMLEASITKDKLALTLGATASGDVSHADADPRVLGAFLSGRLVRLARIFRLELSANYSNATYMNMFGGTAGAGITLFHDAVDFSVYYRRAELQYASNDTFLEQNGIGGVLVVFPASTVMVTAQGETIVGNDINAVQVMGTIAWRPRF